MNASKLLQRPRYWLFVLLALAGLTLSVIGASYWEDKPATTWQELPALAGPQSGTGGGGG